MASARLFAKPDQALRPRAVFKRTRGSGYIPRAIPIPCERCDRTRQVGGNTNKLMTDLAPREVFRSQALGDKPFVISSALGVGAIVKPE